ncbi:hypothetical protein CspeluHIS016_0104370 [Cutaneotrichosporon spelunceum]|uniref:Galactose oxidase n=1 Tax=Cutaneotrichosporon spelunceum TaxID=1672016 RepID=A0AAD3TP09_9TREE|nr:hypothetical protein CspeluHIS016_0104370 [Cutaneotrichosporon spelunceum]
MFHLLFLPSAQALTPTPRWGHRAAYIDSQQAMYVVGGSVAGTGTQITNDVLVLPLNASAAWTEGPTTGLPAHAFASMAVQDNTLVVVGGMTASCALDSITHSLNLSKAEWTSATPAAIHRRHGAAAVPTQDGIMVVGGIADKSTCHNTAAAYTAADTLSVPVTSAAVSSAPLPSSLTGTKLAVADFALASTPEKIYLAGGQAADGTLVPLDTIGVWSSGSWVAQKLGGDVPPSRLGATLIAHPSQELLVLHGGSEYDSASGTYIPSQMLATLNTKTWDWAQPANLKPASGLAYHTSVVTPSGVMVTAFGMGLVEQHATLSPVAATAATSKKTNTAAIAAPVVILTIVLLPLAVFLYRRHQRNRRKRRLASHFSFSTQEDNGNFRNFNGGRGRGSYASSSWSSNMRSAIDRVFRRGSAAGVGDDGTVASSQRAVSPNELAGHEKNWEEIDFGLGRVDEHRREGTYTDLPRRGTPRIISRRDSFEHPGSPGAETQPFSPSTYDADAQLVDVDSSPRLGSPRSDGQQLLSPNAANATLSSSDDHESPFRDPEPTLFPVANAHQSPFHDPDSGMSDAAVDAAAVNDWNALAHSMEARPAFRPLSPSATLSTHRHTYAAAPSLPPLDPVSPMIKHANGTMSSVRTQRIPSASLRLPLATRVPSDSQRTPSDAPVSPSRHLAGARRASVGGERRISAGAFNRNAKRQSPLRVINADE